MAYKYSVGVCTPALDSCGINKFSFKVTSKTNWLTVGVCNLDQVRIKNFDNQYNQDDVGMWVCSSNAEVYNNNKAYTSDGIKFEQGHVIKCIFDADEKTIKIINSTTRQKFVLNMKNHEKYDEFYACVLCNNIGDTIEIIDFEDDDLDID